MKDLQKNKLLFPSDLTSRQLQRVTELEVQAAGLDPAQWLAAVKSHLAVAHAAHATNRMINLRLAAALCDTFTQIAGRWESLPAPARPWLAAAALYFCQSADGEHDLESPIGFEDDVAVLNACLRFAHIDELCLDPLEFDDG